MTQRIVFALALVLAYALMCALIARRWRRTQAEAARALNALNDPSADTLVIHASQTGTAEQLALQTARGLADVGERVRVLALNAVNPQLLAQAKRAWFIVSTYGEGDAPDGASVFADRHMGAVAANGAQLAALSTGVLALGDRQYEQFCAFGHRLQDWLGRHGAQAAFAPIEVNQGDPAALAQWQQALGLSGDSDLGVAQAPFTPWQLQANTHINPGSAGNPMHWLGLTPAEGSLPDWQAGDLVQLVAAGSPDQRPREYSIASTPAQGQVQLMVRHERQQQADGSWQQGLASSQLCGAAPGQRWLMRIQPHAGFHIGENGARPLILIGNGSGLAGLHAHILARQGAHAASLTAANSGQNQSSQADTWMIYGERQRAHDAWFAPQWQAWLDDGTLSALSLSYSRDSHADGSPRYVQDIVRREAEQLRGWVARGAAIYLCGSLRGMASDVDAALNEVLGDTLVSELRLAGKLRRDVY